MTTQDVAKQFLGRHMAHTPYRKAPLNGWQAWHGASFSSDGDRLRSYETVVARWDGDVLRVTTRKYSNTTSKQLYALKRECEKQGIAYELGDF